MFMDPLSPSRKRSEIFQIVSPEVSLYTPVEIYASDLDRTKSQIKTFKSILYGPELYIGPRPVY